MERNRTASTIGTTLLSLLLVSPLALGQGTQGGSEAKVGPVPRAPLDLLYAREYEVERAMTFCAGGEALEVKKGYILVIKADLDLLQPLNSPDFLLLGETAALHKVNSGYKDGHLVIVTPALDLEKALVFFGERMVPERMTKDFCDQQLAAARKRGIKPFTRSKVEAARKLAGAKLKVKDMNELWFETRSLILEYAPAERDMAMSLRKGDGK